MTMSMVMVILKPNRESQLKSPEQEICRPQMHDFDEHLFNRPGIGAFLVAWKYEIAQNEPHTRLPVFIA
jgi:hypothetical protein